MGEVRASLAEFQRSGQEGPFILPAGMVVSQPDVASAEEASYDARLRRLASGCLPAAKP